ncbi:MAG: MBL fold metallo-hydrolase [Proteobacteria bacterium]|nr:MBL fold metallo-hydrolase [Pseudomonadota bacterium]
MDIEKILNNLVWYGHDTFCLKASGKTIYFDPYKLQGEKAPADIIFITHDHFDHCSPEDVEKICKSSTIIISEPRAAEKFIRKAVTKSMKPGDKLEIEAISVEAVPAYNTNKKFHPKSNNWIGFILTVEGVRLYHAGDTDHIPEMKFIKTDIALLPVSGTYVMTAGEAVGAALELNPRVAIPMHLGGSVGTMEDARIFAQGLEGKIRVEILKIQP